MAAITETWLHGGLDDSLVSIGGYTLHRRDRSGGRGGGVCLYVSHTIHSKRKSDLENPLYECMWVNLRPCRLPRCMTNMMIGVIYIPPGKSAEELKDLIQYIVDTADHVCSNHPDCGFAIMGDFNRLNISDILLHHDFKQVVESPTRSTVLLDLIITDFNNFYNKPETTAPLGSSDHNVITWNPVMLPDGHHTEDRTKNNKRRLRRFTRSSMDAFGRWISHHTWFSGLDSNVSVDRMTESFMHDLTDAIDAFFPTKTVRIHNTDKPWMTSSIKLLILNRQRAFHSGMNERWKHLRNKVRKTILQRKETFYRETAHNLKGTNPRKWWNIINKISGRSANSTPISYEDEAGNVMSGINLAERLNKFYISATSDLLPLDRSNLPAYLPAQYELPEIRSSEVCKKLSEMNVFKSVGPDGIPNRIWKTFAPELSLPITEIFNASFSACTFPTIWKDSFISPIPKVTPVTADGDLRPISPTPCIAKFKRILP